MCKINVKTDFNYDNICKYEHEKNMTRLWCKIVPKTNVEQTEKIERSYFYLHLKEASKEAFICALNKKAFENLPNL
jgi:hypothetical protein